MNTQKTSAFLHNIANTLDKKIVSLDKKGFEKITDSIQEFAQDENQNHREQITHEFLMLADLLAHAHLKKTICLEEIRKDNNALSYAAIRFIFILVAAFAIYYIFIHYEKPENTKLQQLIEELKEFGIVVTKKHTGHGKSSQYYLDVVCTRDIYENEYYTVRNLLEQAYHTHDNIHGWIQWAFIIVGGCLLLAIRSCFNHMYNYFRQPSQKQHEKWEILKQILWQRKEELRNELAHKYNYNIEKYDNDDDYE